MAYNSDIPQPTDILQQSQADLLANFQALKQLIDINHSTFGSATEGKHAKVAVPNLGVTPPFGAGDAVLYNNTTTLTGGGELFIRKPSGAPPIPVTATSGTVNGWAYLPSGILLKWGQGGGSGLVVQAFPVGANFPVFGTVYNVQVTTQSAGGTDTDVATRVATFNNTQIQIYCSRRSTTGAATASFNYFAIGT